MSNETTEDGTLTTETVGYLYRDENVHCAFCDRTDPQPIRVLLRVQQEGDRQFLYAAGVVCAWCASTRDDILGVTEQKAGQAVIDE